LQTNYPGIAKLWHPDRNSPFLPSHVTPLSNKSVWWCCSNNKTHVWRAKVAAVTRSWEGGTNGCPYCAGSKVAAETCLSARCPEVAAKWHPSRNHPLLPSEVTVGSNRNVWWQCQTKLTHEWQATIDSVVRLHKGGTSGCPYCYGVKASSENNLLTKYPEIAAQWHSSKNLPLEPWQITPGSDKLVWWFCPKGSAHVWQTRVKDFVKCKRNGTSGCPHCRWNTEYDSH